MLIASRYRPGATLRLSGGKDMNRRSVPTQLSRTYHPRVRFESDKSKKQINPSDHSIMDRRWTPMSPATYPPCKPCILVNRKVQIHLDIFVLHSYTSDLPFYFPFIQYQCFRDPGVTPDSQHGWIDSISGKNKQDLVSTPGNGLHPRLAIFHRYKPCILQWCKFQSHLSSSYSDGNTVFSSDLP